MDITSGPLLIAVCTALCGLASGDILSYSTPQNDFVQNPQTEVSPVQLEISIPIAAEQLLQLADTASPDVWRNILRRTPDAARRALLAQLRARRRNLEQGGDQSLKKSQGSRDQHPQRSQGARDQQRSNRPREWHQQRARGGGLASRLSSYSGLGVDSSTRRSYSTLERDAEGRRRVSLEQPRSSSARHQTPTNRPPSRATNQLGQQSGHPQPSGGYTGPSSGYRPPSRDAHRPTSSQRPLSDVFTDTSSSDTSDVSSSYSSWESSFPTSPLSPPSHRSKSVPSDQRTVLRSQPGPPNHGGSPLVTTYRPRGQEVTTYRPRKTDATTYRRGRAEITTYRPARFDRGTPSVQHGPPRRPVDSGYTGQERHQHGATGHSSEQQQDHHHEEEGLEWLMDVVPGIPGEDYPVLASIPVTSFSCAGRPQGYYSDVSTRCQVYHVCHGTFQMSSFICPNGTVFSQPLATCDWWFNTDCSDDLPLPSSTFRVSRQTSRFMFEDDWVDDYEDFDVTDTDQPEQTHSQHHSNHRESKAARRKSSAPSAAQRRRPGNHSAPSGKIRSAPSGRNPSASSGRNPSASSGSVRGVTWRSPYSNLPVSRTTEAYRRPERHITVSTTPSSEQGGNRPTEDGKQRQNRRTRTFVATVRTPTGGNGEQKSVVSKPFVIRVSYGGKSGRTTKELKFGPEAARNFLSRAQMRRWSFTSGSSIARRIGVTETAGNSEEQVGSTSREARVLEKAGDKSFDFEIGRRPRQAQVGSESQLRARGVLPQDVTSYRSSSPGASRRAPYHPSPTRPMAQLLGLAEVAPPETSVEPPTVAGGDLAGNRARRRSVAASVRDSEVQRRRVISEGSTIPSLTQEESQREEAPSVRWGGDNGRLSFAELTTDDPGSSNGGNELITDDSVDFDYDVLMNSDSFKNFGLKLPSAPSPTENRQNPGL